MPIQSRLLREPLILVSFCSPLWMRLFRVALVLSSVFLNLCTYALWTRIVAGNKANGKGTTAAEHWGVSTTFHCDAPVFSHFDQLHFLICFGLFFFQCYTCYICSTGTGGCHCWRLTTAGNSGNSSVSMSHISCNLRGAPIWWFWHRRSHAVIKKTDRPLRYGTYWSFIPININEIFIDTKVCIMVYRMFMIWVYPSDF